MLRANTAIHIRMITRTGKKIKEVCDMSEARKFETEEEQGLEDVIVLDDASAEMILRQLKDAEEQYDRMKSWYDRQISHLKDIRDRTREWAESCLRPYFEMVPTTGKKIRSYKMPGGTLKLAKQDPKWETGAELVTWLEANGLTEFVAVEKKARWGDFKETLKDAKTKEIRTVEAEDGTLQVVTKDGEIVPGVKGIVREDEFSIKVQ